MNSGIKGAVEKAGFNSRDTHKPGIGRGLIFLQEK